MNELNIFDLDKEDAEEKNANEVRKKINNLDEKEAEASLESLIVNHPQKYLEVLTKMFTLNYTTINKLDSVLNDYYDVIDKMSGAKNETIDLSFM